MFFAFLFIFQKSIQTSDFFGELKENSKATTNVTFSSIRASTGFQNRNGVHLPASMFCPFTSKKRSMPLTQFCPVCVNRMFVGLQQIGSSLMLDCLSKDGTNPGKHSPESTV